MRKKLYFFQLLTLLSTFCSAQTAVTNFSYGPFTASKFFVKGSKIYFLGKYAADSQEWFSLNTSTNITTQITNDHYRSSGGVIFRAPVLIGNNVFVSSGKPTALQDLEFSRFNLNTETEQWVDLYPGMNGINPNYSDPIIYAEDPSNGYVYFRPAITGESNQFHYWKPSDNSITKLASIGGATGIGQNSSSPIIFIGDSIYTSATIATVDGLLCIHKTNGGYRFLSGGAFKNVRDITAVKNKLFFCGRNNAAFPNDDYNFYVYNPASGIPVKLTNYTTTEADGNISGFSYGPDSTLFVNVSYYNTTPSQGDFFSIDPVTEIITYRPGPTSTQRNTFFHATATHVYVVRFDGGAGRDIYKIKLSDNSSTRITSSTMASIGLRYEASNGRFYFSGGDATYGTELYDLNPSTDVVTRLSDINSGTANALPANFTETAGQLYFSAATGAGATIDREIYAYTFPVVLPVTLKDFTAQKQQSQVLLQWQTASEQNSKDFTIQHSIDGTSFNDIGLVNASGNSNSTRNYSFLHSQPKNGNNYYRLKQTDLNGNSTYSAVRLVNFLVGENAVLVSNPVKNKKLQVKSNSNEVLILFSNDGKQLLKATLHAGLNSIDVSACPKGVYIIKIGDTSTKAVIE